MSTFIEVRPVMETDKDLKRVTTFARIDNDDFYGTVRVESSNAQGTRIKTDYQFNFNGIESGTQVDSAISTTPTNFKDVIDYVRVSKLDNQERVVIGVKFYYPENEPDKVPAAGLYWYDPDKQYPFGGPAEDTKSEARNPLFEDAPGAIAGSNQFTTEADPPIALTNGIEIWNKADLTLGALLSANITQARSQTKSYTEQRLYERLADSGGNAAQTIINRREHLKQQLRGIIDHPHFAIWMANVDEDANLGGGDAVSQVRNLIARPQSFVIWLEMMANLISINGNFDSEQKFNILNGNLGLGGYDIFTKPSTPVYGTTQIRQASNDRTTWHIYLFGSVGAAPSYEYSKPQGTTWTAARDTTTGFTLTGANLGNTWLDWVRG